MSEISAITKELIRLKLPDELIEIIFSYYNKNENGFFNLINKFRSTYYKSSITNYAPYIRFRNTSYTPYDNFGIIAQDILLKYLDEGTGKIEKYIEDKMEEEAENFPYDTDDE